LRVAGFALALAAAVAFGLYMLPRHFSTLRAPDFSAAMGVGSLVTLSVPLAFATGRFTALGFALAVGAGLIWALATHLFVLSVDALDITRATPVKNLAGVFGTLFGLLLLHEYATSGSLTIAQLVLGSLLIGVGAYLIGGLAGSAARGATPRGAKLRGFLWAFVSALCFGFYIVPLRLSAPLGAGFAYFGLGLGAMLGLSLPRWLRGTWRLPPREFGLGALAGALLALGAILGVPATRLIGLSIAWPLTQLNTFVALAASVFWLREYDPRQARPRLLSAGILTLFGLVLLALV